MNIQKLKFSQFRNYESASFSFDPERIHILYGRNAQGKTNILESIYFLSHLRSFRTSKTNSLIRHGEDGFVIDCLLENNGRREDLKVIVNENKKRLYRYGSPVPASSSFVGIVNAILFCPDDMNLFSDSPKRRRQFMDMELVKLSHTYTQRLSRYQKLLKSRNLALKAFRPDPILIETLTSQMVEDQEVLIRQRDKFLKRLQEQMNTILPLFSSKGEALTIQYKTCVRPDEDIHRQLSDAYSLAQDKDRQMKTTSVGIHKDDILFYLDGRLLTQTASQGQKRTVLLSLKLALAHIIQEKTGQYPIMLLDDVFSELDPQRRAALISALPAKMQIFITTTEKVEPIWFDRPVNYYTVENGVMKEGIFDV